MQIKNEDYFQHVWILMPAFNEEKVVFDVVKSVVKCFPKVLLIDDGSTDNTANFAKNAGAIVVRHPFCLGQGAALQTGFELLNEIDPKGIVVTFDADGQHQVGDIHNLIDALVNENADIVLASRFKGRAINIPFLKRLTLKFASFLISKFTRLIISDYHNGLRALHISIAASLSLEQYGMAHASEIISKINSLNLKYIEVPATIKYTTYSMRKGQSISNGFFILFDLIIQRCTKW